VDTGYTYTNVYPYGSMSVLKYSRKKTPGYGYADSMYTVFEYTRFSCDGAVNVEEFNNKTYPGNLRVVKSNFWNLLA